MLRKKAKWQEISENKVDINQIKLAWSNPHPYPYSHHFVSPSLPRWGFIRKSLFLSLPIRPANMHAFPPSHHLVSLESHSKLALTLIQVEGETQVKCCFLNKC